MSMSSDMTDQQRINKVRTVVTKAGEDLRQQYPILKHQNFHPYFCATGNVGFSLGVCC